VTHLYYFVTDLSELKATEAALKESEQRFRTVVENSLEGITVLDLASGRYTFVSPAQAVMTGFLAEELLAMSASDVLDRVHPEDRHVPAEQLAAITGGRSEGSNVEYRWKVRSGEYRWLSDSRKAIRDVDGRVVAVVGVAFDVTDRRRAEEERSVLQGQLALASRLAALGTLVAGVAHEINNPLAGDMAGQGVAMEIVREVRERLRGGGPLSLEEEVRALDHALESLEEAQECGLRIATIVKDLSIFGRSDARRERVRPAEVVDGARRWLPAAVARNVSIAVEDGNAPEVFVARGQLEQVVLNLLANAARATLDGRRNPVVVRTGPGSPGMARIEVVDRGTGIDPAILDRIFEPFFTTRPAGTERGSGLGLAISQAIVAAHQGTLTVESELGRGSTFRVELPVAPAEA
jgi:PAS domain S-box-containing protein